MRRVYDVVGNARERDTSRRVLKPWNQRVS